MTFAWWILSVQLSLSIFGAMVGCAVWAVTSRIIARQDAMEAYFKTELEKLKGTQ